MALSQSLLLTVPLAPLAGALIAGLAGRWVGRRGAHFFTILGVFIAFVCSVLVLQKVGAGARFNETLYEWMVLGKLVMEALKMLDDVAYVRFASVYKNFREAKEFEELLGELTGEDDNGESGER